MSDEEEVLPSHQHLQYPVGYADSKPIIKALETGASLADRLLLEEYTLRDVNPKMLELHLDSCISAKIDRVHKEGTEVTLDYSTILPKSYDVSEMKAVRTITEISRLQHLLVHPLISSFIYIKWQLAMVVKGHPISSRYIVMLRTVTLTFFHFFLSYSLLLIAFALSFYKLFYEKSWKDSSNIAAAGNYTDSKSEPPGFISGIALTFFNMIVMLTGELNASSFKFETFIHGVLFVAFVLVVPIILLNLLCGLAVYDVDMIRENAEIIGYKEVVKYIVFTEKYIAAIADLRPQWNFLKQKIFLQPNELLNKRLTLYPYKHDEKTKLLGRRTIRRIKQFLFLNENKHIIQHLETIEAHRKEIRELLATCNWLVLASRMSKESLELLNFSDAITSLLLNYVVGNHYENIKQLVKTEGTGILHVDHEEYDKPILHIALDDKSEHVLPTTIRCLIDLGADIYKEIVGQSEAIHSAVSGQNPRLLETIVNSIQTPDRLNATATGNTALNLLVKHGNCNSIGFMECVCILLKSGINVNIADNKSMTPVLWACVKSYKDVIKAILEYGRCVDIDTHKFEEKTARDYIIQRNLYEGVLPAKKSLDNNENNVTSPLWYLENNDEGGFFKLKEIAVNDENERGTLLQQACDRGLINVVKYLMDHNVDVQKTTLKNKKIPLEIAAYNGYDEIFEILLGKYETIPKNILTTLLRNMPLHKGAYARYKNCLNALLDSEKPIPVNERSGLNNTPLHYACMLNDPSISLKLLKNGANLANRNDFDSIPLEDIDSKILQQHFDDCIDVKESGDKQGIIVNFDYTSILPIFDKKQVKTKDEEAALIEVTKPFNETDVIRVISQTAELRHLLIHPLITSFICIKWHRMRWLFWINLMLFVLFAMCFFVYVFLPTGKNLEGNLRLWVNILWILLVITYVMLFLRELLQLILSCRTHCCSLSNILDIGMLVACFYPIFYKSTDTIYKQFCSVAMVLLALELMVLGAQYPRLSTCMVMLRTVTKNFFFFLLWYAILIFAFALSFYVLYNKNDNDQNFTNSTDVEEGKGEAGEQPFFDDLGLTVIKTIVMLTGEFDASSINFNSFWNRVIFMLFVFMISIILFNLLNGLAVSDTQQIKSEAEIVAYAERVGYIIYLENIIRGQWLSQRDDCLIGDCLRGWGFNLVPKSSVRQISLIPNYLPENKASVRLYYDGLVMESEPETKGCFDKLTCVHVDKKTVKRVKQILHERNAESDEKKQIECLLHIIDTQKNLLDQQRKEIDTLKEKQF
ncbi:pain [Trypoxylus dichotomus]